MTPRPASKLQSAICDVELTGDGAPDWVHLFPAGRTTGRGMVASSTWSTRRR